MAGNVGSAFVLHVNSHCVGIVKKTETVVSVSDPSYTSKVEISLTDMSNFMNTFFENHTDTTSQFFKIKTGAYNPMVMSEAFKLTAGSNDAEEKLRISQQRVASKLAGRAEPEICLK